MANKYTTNKVIRGTFGKVWLDDERLSNIKSFEAKVALNFEKLEVNGELGERQRYMGYSGTGTMTLHKFDSTIIRKYQAGIKSGDLPELKIVASLDDPQSYGAERVALTGVTLTELTLNKFENKGLLEEEVPFSFSSFEFLDMIS